VSGSNDGSAAACRCGPPAVTIAGGAGKIHKPDNAANRIFVRRNQKAADIARIRNETSSYPPAPPATVNSKKTRINK
jgi:hypothetical protein